MKTILGFLILAVFTGSAMATPLAQGQSSSLTAAAQDVQNYYVSQNLEKMRAGEKSGSVSQAGRIPLTALMIGSGMYLGRSVDFSAGENSSLSVKPSVRDRSGEIRLQSHDSFSEFLQNPSESRLGVGQNLPKLTAQTKLHFLPGSQDLRAIVSKSVTSNLSVEAERSVQSHFESLRLSYSVSF